MTKFLRTTVRVTAIDTDKVERAVKLTVSYVSPSGSPVAAVLITSVSFAQDDADHKMGELITINNLKDTDLSPNLFFELEVLVVAANKCK